MATTANEPPWLMLARQYIGEREWPGKRHNPLILRWWESIKAPFRDDESPWCSALVGGVLEEAGWRSSRSAAARSYMSWGARLDYMATGCIVVLSRPGAPWSGHVGFLIGLDDRGRVLLLGGNQGNAVSIAAFAMDRVIGLRWPMPVLTDGLLPTRFTPVRTFASTAPPSESEA